MSSKLTLKIVRQTNTINTASVIFFHGSGDSGNGFYDYVHYLIGDFATPHIKYIFPTAPSQPYTPLDGEHSNVWFDRLDISPDAQDHKESLDRIQKEVKRLIDDEVKSGIPLDKIIVGGFSMGGALALHTAYRFYGQQKLAGCFALSSFLSTESLIYQSLKSIKSNHETPLLMCHGDHDTLVPHDWGKTTAERLIEMGVRCEYRTIRNALHELKKTELQTLMEWIKKLLPYEKAV